MNSPIANINEDIIEDLQQYPHLSIIFELLILKYRHDLCKFLRNVTPELIATFINLKLAILLKNTRETVTEAEYEIILQSLANMLERDVEIARSISH